MKSMSIRIFAAVLAAGMLAAAVGCDDKNKDTDTSQVQTADTAIVSETQPQQEASDIGEHRDYDKQNANGEYSGGVLVVDQDGSKRCMEMFTAEEESGQFYASELNAMKERLGTQINVYSMAVPTACELYCPSNYRVDIDSQSTIMENIADAFVNVKNVDVMQTLINHNAENIYFRTDTRWTPLGAYYAGRVFAKTAGVPYADISEYTPSKAADYVGNMSMFIDYMTLEELEKDPDEFVYYKPKTKFKTYYYDENFEFLTDGEFFEEVPEAMYDTFYKGGFYCVKLETEVKSGRKLIIVKDNAGTALAPFMTSSFDEIYVVDKDYLEANLVEMVEDFKITDVLYCLDMFTITSQNVYQLETLRTQATHGRLEDNATDSDADEPNENADSAITTDTDSEDNTGEESEIQYIYDVGLNNSVGVAEPSETSETVEEEPIPEDQYEYDPYYDDGEDYGYDYEE